MNIKESFRPAGQQVAFKSALTGKYVVCHVNNIIYMQKVKETHDCSVVFINALGESKSVVVRMSISELHDITPNQFVKVNRHTIVNSRFIEAYDDCNITLLTPFGQLTMGYTCWEGTRFVEIEK